MQLHAKQRTYMEVLETELLTADLENALSTEAVVKHRSQFSAAGLINPAGCLSPFDVTTSPYDMFMHNQ